MLIFMKKTKKKPFLTLGRNIANRRERLGLNQDSFADKIGLAVSSYKDIERGVSEGHIDTRIAIASKFNCSIAELYSDGTEPANFSAAGAFLSKFASLSPKLQKIVWAIVFEDPELYSSHPDLKRVLK